MGLMYPLTEHQQVFCKGPISPIYSIICLDYVLQTSIDLTKENGSTLQKVRSRRIDYADDIALLTNTPTQAKSLLHCMKQGAGGIGLNMNADKTEYMCINQKVDISALNGGSLKIVNKFTYLGSRVSSTVRA